MTQALFESKPPVEIERRGKARRTGAPPYDSQPVIDRWVRGQSWMDGLAEAIQGLVGGFYGALGAPGRGIKDLMHGTTVLGHPLHPALSDVPVGAWTVAVIADWLFVATGRIPPVAGDLALALGIAAALLAAASGYTDFHETFAQVRRMALTHGLLMTLIVIVMLVSLGVRLWGGHTFRMPAIELSTLGWLMTLFGAYVGGHLTFGLGTVVNRNAFMDGPEDYVRVGSPEDFPEGKPVRVDAKGLPTLIVRVEGTLLAIGAVCSHAGGPLDEGKLDGDVVTCPWHGSRFCLADGRVKGGPATFSQPQLMVRERDSAVEVKLAHPIH